MTRQSPENYARAILLDATTLATTIDAAMSALDAGLAGWPSSCPGAAPAEAGPLSEGECDQIVQPAGRVDPTFYRICGHPLPCPDHPTNSSSIVERTAGTDTARRDLEQMQDDIRVAAFRLARAARTSLTWGTPRLDGTTVTKRLAAIDSDIWCANCSQHGHKNPRLEARTECEFCAEVRREFGVRAPKDLLDLRSAKGRLYTADYVRIFARHGWTDKVAAHQKELIKRRRQREKDKGAA